MENNVRIPLPRRRVTRDVTAWAHLLERFQHDSLYHFPAFDVRFLSCSHARAHEFHFSYRSIRKVSVVKEVAERVLNHIHRDTKIRRWRDRGLVGQESDFLKTFCILPA